MNDKQHQIIKDAIKAIYDRTFFSQYPEHPSSNIYGDTADADGRNWFKEQIGKKFDELYCESAKQWQGYEESPYLQESLDITYPVFTPEQLISNGTEVFESWRKTSIDERAAILINSLESLKDRFFQIAYATMHTTGQGYMMAFQASGPHAADRALEAIAAGYEEVNRFPKKAFWDKPMGKFNLQLNKEWRAVPKGISLVVGCSTFPTWNSIPGLYASLITGNPVIVKPHPGAVLPIAIVVAELQRALSDAGQDPRVVQLAIDSLNAPITVQLAQHTDVKLIDYTGNSEFGDYLEGLKGKTVFTEKTGVNSVILHSTDQADKMISNLAFSICLYSGQMCTAPQNIFISKDGIDTPNGKIGFEEIANKFVQQINGLVDNPKAGPFVLGAIQNKNTCERIERSENLSGKVLLKSRSIENPMFKNARTSTPVLLEVESDQMEVFSKELFGPIALLIKTESVEQSVELARELAEQHGAISCGAYCMDEAMKEFIFDQMSLAATPVSFNLMTGVYVNQHAGFSDFHVTGGNPAGNASFTNPEFVIKRFTWVGKREPAVSGE